MVISFVIFVVAREVVKICSHLDQHGEILREPKTAGSRNESSTVIVVNTN